MLDSQIKSQNPRIRSNTTEITKRKQEARKPGGEDRPGKPREATTPGERTAGYHSAAVVPDIGPNFSSLVRKNCYINYPILLRTRHVLFDPCSSTIAMLLTTVLLLLLEMCPVSAGIAERAGGAAALFKVIVFVHVSVNCVASEVGVNQCQRVFLYGVYGYRTLSSRMCSPKGLLHPLCLSRSSDALGRAIGAANGLGPQTVHRGSFPNPSVPNGTILLCPNVLGICPSHGKTLDL